MSTNVSRRSFVAGAALPVCLSAPAMVSNALADETDVEPDECRRRAFTTDYGKGAAPEVIDAILAVNGNHYMGYTTDEVTDAARSTIRELAGISEDAVVEFLTGGTQANIVTITSLLNRYHSIVTCDSSHIFVHETGGIEAEGHKVETVPNIDGKLTAEQVETALSQADDVNFPIRQLVEIAEPTELGTMYTLEELTAISEAAHRHNAWLMVDGARLAFSLGSDENDVTIADLGRLSDVFWIGGTKCGAFFGEAIVFPNTELGAHFRKVIRQMGGLNAKGWLFGAQFNALFENDLYTTMGRHAVECSMQIKNALQEAGVDIAFDSFTNQLFPLFTPEQSEAINQYFTIPCWDVYDEQRSMYRICCSWYTKQDEVDELIEAIKTVFA